jgi:hypothetical protein
MAAKAKVKSAMSFQYIRRLNGIMSGVHPVQAVVVPVAGLPFASISRFRLSRERISSSSTFPGQDGPAIPKGRQMGGSPLREARVHPAEPRGREHAVIAPLFRDLPAILARRAASAQP